MNSFVFIHFINCCVFSSPTIGLTSVSMLYGSSMPYWMRLVMYSSAVVSIVISAS